MAEEAKTEEKTEEKRETTTEKPREPAQEHRTEERREEKREERRETPDTPTTDCPECDLTVATAKLGSHRFKAHGVERRKAPADDGKQERPTGKRQPPPTPPKDDDDAKPKKSRWDEVRASW